MQFIRFAVLVLGLAAITFAVANAGRGGPERKDGAKPDGSRAVLDAWLARHPGAENAKVAPVENAALDHLFPGEHFYSVRFSRFPRAQLAPKPLRLENVVVVRPDQSVELLSSLDALKKFLGERLFEIRSEAKAREAVLASLRLAEEFYQDGSYSFHVDEGSVSAKAGGGRLVASGKSVVTKGGQGELTAELVFTTSGKLDAEKLGLRGKVRPDVRPR
jgi:hypothetical protein